MADEKKQLLIVTGMSGAGKTVVAHDLDCLLYTSDAADDLLTV